MGELGLPIEVATNPFDALEKAEKDGGSLEIVRPSKAGPRARATEREGDPSAAAAAVAPEPAALPPQGEGMEDWEDMLDE